MNNRPSTRSSGRATGGTITTTIVGTTTTTDTTTTTSGSRENYVIQTNSNKRKVGCVDAEDNLIDEQPPNKKLNSSDDKESSFPRRVRPESISKVGSKPNALTANMVIMDQHLSQTHSLHHHPITRTPLLEFQEKHEAKFLDHLKELIKMEQTLEVGLEMAALVNLLKLFNYSQDLDKQKLVIEASSGAQILQDGLIQVKKGQDLVREAIVQMLHPKPA